MTRILLTIFLVVGLGLAVTGALEMFQSLSADDPRSTLISYIGGVSFVSGLIVTVLCIVGDQLIRTSSKIEEHLGQMVRTKGGL